MKFKKIKKFKKKRIVLAIQGKICFKLRSQVKFFFINIKNRIYFIFHNRNKKMNSENKLEMMAMEKCEENVRVVLSFCNDHYYSCIEEVKQQQEMLTKKGKKKDVFSFQYRNVEYETAIDVKDGDVGDTDEIVHRLLSNLFVQDDTRHHELTFCNLNLYWYIYIIPKLEAWRDSIRHNYPEPCVYWKDNRFSAKKVAGYNSVKNFLDLFFDYVYFNFFSLD
jgi:hypothetical protein